MLYGTDKGVLMIVRIHEEDKLELAKTHNIQQAKFPRGKNWFSLMIDNTFTNRDQVYRIINMAIHFAQNPPKKAPAKPKTTTPKVTAK